VIKINLPIVHPDYGYNRYAIWRRNNPVNWGAADGYLDIHNPFAPAPEGTGRIVPSQIINKHGHLADGFTFETVDGEGTRTWRSSSEASVGSGTLDAGGAVAVHFQFPLKLTFYDAFIDDVSAQFEPHLSSAVEGEQVRIGVVVRSTFEEELKGVPYPWTITDRCGNAIEPVTFVGHATAGEGGLDLTADKEHLHYAFFTMPDSSVKVIFEDGTRPEEAYLDNNRLELDIRSVK
jgi:hypothetical protein